MRFCVGSIVKLVFIQEPNSERMWVIVRRKLKDGRYSGTLDSDPLIIDMRHGQRVVFSASQVVDVW